MHNRIPSRRRQGVTKGKGPRQGETVPVQGKTQDRVPRTPSGRLMPQPAREDIERGVVEADKKEPVLDETYENVREDPDLLKKLSP